MKKNIYLSIALAAFLFSACDSEDNVLSNNSNNQEYTILARLPQKATTRMIGTDESEGSTYSMKFEWESTDNCHFYFYNESSTWTRNDKQQESITDGIASFKLSSRPSLENDTKNYIYANTIAALSNTNCGGNAASPTTSFCFYLDCSDRIYNSDDDVANNNPMFGAVEYTYAGGVNYSSDLILHNVCSLVKFEVTLPEDVASISSVRVRNYISGTGGVSFKIKQNIKVNSDGSFEYVGNQTYNGTTRSNTTGTQQITGLSWTPTSNILTFYAIIIPQELNGFQIDLSGKKTDNSSFSGKKFNKTFASAPKTLEAGKMYGAKYNLSGETF